MPSPTATDSSFKSMPISKITLIGSGTMGANIALHFAAHGQAVSLHDSNAAQLEKALRVVRQNAALLSEHGLITEAVDTVVARIRLEPEFESAAAGADLVIEAVPEKMQLKQRLFMQLDRVCGPQAILASNSSTFVPSSMAVGFVSTERKARFLVMHFWNPAHLMPLVEIVPHPDASPPVVDSVMALLVRCGKRPVVVRKEIAGFIGNRLAFALQREAMDLVAKGVASPEDIDTVAKNSFGRRIPITGIFGTADLGGLDVYLEVCRSLFPDLCSDRTPPAALGNLVRHGRLGIKSGEGWNRYTEAQIALLNESLTRELVHQLHRARRDEKAEAPQE
ncbi:MAG: 3-hydroxybutyryl-CoA dehydrogenase [Verrucomicrobia bacterium]|nr:3-hydroxybutyryl-CoA dehydrogenase [Verrucomicrobiota bacterium]